MSQTSTFVRLLLKEGAFAHFCTTNARNHPHVVPVFFVFDMTRCHAYFLFSKDSIKVRNLRLRPKVSFAVDVRDHVNPLGNKGVMIQGRAEVGKSNDPDAEIERIRKLFEEKYCWSGPGSFFRRPEDEKVVVDVSVSKVSCWQGTTFLSCPKFCIASDKRTYACPSDRGDAEESRAQDD